jgi:hypothetical protein
MTGIAVITADGKRAAKQSRDGGIVMNGGDAKFSVSAVCDALKE